MYTYIILYILILLLGAFYVNKIVSIGGHLRLNGNYIFYFLCGIILLFISAFRGDFSADYKGYEGLFLSFSNYSFKEIIKRPLYNNPENGFVLLLKCLSFISQESTILFLVTSIIVLMCNISYFKKNSFANPILAIFLFCEVGLYFSSFNLVRQAVACSLALLGTKYLIENKMINYFTIVIFSSFFHISVLSLIPYYLLTQIRITKKNLPLIVIIILVFSSASSSIVEFVGEKFWPWYDIYSMGGYNWKNIFLPVIIVFTGIVLFYLTDHSLVAAIRKNSKMDNTKSVINNTCIWAALIFASFQISGLVFRYGQRMSLPFCTYTISFYCIQVNNSRNRKLITIISVILIIVFGLFTKKNIPYYFIWNR